MALKYLDEVAVGLKIGELRRYVCYEDGHIGRTTDETPLRITREGKLWSTRQWSDANPRHSARHGRHSLYAKLVHLAYSVVVMHHDQQDQAENFTFGQIRNAATISKDADLLEHIHTLPTAQQDEALAKIRAIEREAMVKQIPQAGLVTLMDYLTERGIRKGICTRNFREPVAHLLANHLPGHLDAITPIITRDFKPTKPSPAGILHIAHAWNITATAEVPRTPRQERLLLLIMVGDSIDDIEAGYEAGALTVLLKSEGKEGLEADERTDIVISRLGELIGLLDDGLKSAKSG